MRRFVLLLLPGCLFPSLDDLSASDGSAPDGSNDVVVESSSLDAGDAKVEAGPFCPQTNAVLCADFDETDGGGYGAAWGYVYAPGTTTVQESNAFSKSPAFSLLMSTTSTDYSALARKDITFVSGVTLEFDVRIAARGDNCSIAHFSNGTGGLSLNPGATQTGISEATTLADGGVDYGGTSNTTFVPTDAWVHVIDDYDRTKNQLTVTFDGTVAFDYTPTNPEWAQGTTVRVAIGIGSSSNTTMYFDNVVIRSR